MMISGRPGRAALLLVVLRRLDGDLLGAAQVPHAADDAGVLLLGQVLGVGPATRAALLLV
jgi:hypothetical protein